MINYLTVLQNPGFFVWASFGITFLSCSIMYYRTRKELKKYEKEFILEFKKLSNVEKQEILNNSRIIRNLFSSYKQII